jgi:hypothetical protein
MMLLAAPFISVAQNPLNQIRTVGVAFVDFTDEPGGVGYTGDQPRQIDNDKYQAQYWYDFFFKDEGDIPHPDASTHGSAAQDPDSRKWTGPYEPYHYGSVARWCKMNSYGGHHMQPFPMSVGFDGILNTIDANGKIEWIRLNMTKSAAIGSLSYYVKPRISPYWQQCDVVILVAAGQGGPHVTDLLTAGPPFFSIISEKTSSDDSTDAILNFSMAGVIHEYIHAAFNHGDYGYDLWTYIGNDRYKLWNRRARWTGISGMYPHSLPNRPYHLDPWAKLKFGWIDYEILTEDEYVNKSLPIIAQPEDDGIWPKVLVIPIDVPWSFNEPDWDQGHYLIIENRRRVPDSYDDKIADENSDGGFLVWEFDQRLNDDERYGLTLVEADGNYDMKFKDSRWIYNQKKTTDIFPHQVFLPTASDFWSEPAVLSTWSRHLLGMLDPTTMFGSSSLTYAPDVVRTVPRQITIRFGEYDAEGDENVIPYISVGSPTSNTQIATKNNNQSKLIKDGDKLVFVATADYSGDAEQGKITVFESLDNGLTWNDVRFMNDIDIYEVPTWDSTWVPSSFTPDFQGVNTWKPAVAETGAAAPALAKIEDSWRVVWQRKLGNGTSRLLIAGPTDSIGADITDLDIDRSDDEVTPVIAWGRVLPGTPDTTLLKVVWCTDSGLYQMRSSDGGATWLDSSAVHIAGTSSASINPSLAMSANYEVLVYEEQEAIKIIIDGGTAVNLSDLHPEFLRNLTPSVTLAGSTAHVVWAAEVKEKIPQLGPGEYHHIKPVHKVLDLTQVPTKANVSNLINDVWNRRLEEAQRPVMAVRDVPTEDGLGSLLWSVYDHGEGRRLRTNAFSYNAATEKYEWERNNPLTSYSHFTANRPVYHPAIASDGSDIRYILTRAEEGLFAIRTAALPPPIPEWERHLGEKEVAISVLDAPTTAWQNRIVYKQPLLLDNQGQQLAVPDIAGIPYDGFDGSHDGPRIAELTMTPKLFLMAGDIVTWQIQVQRLPGNIYNDTSTVRLDMYDVVSQQIIESSVQILLPPDKLDSTFVLTVALPPSHYPGDTITVSVDVRGDAYDSGSRYYTAMQNIICVEEAMEKSPPREAPRTATAPGQPTLHVYPQPASGVLYLSMQAPPYTQAVVSMYDYLGRRVKRWTASVSGDGNLRLSTDISGLRSGVYECRVATEESTIRRIINIVR